MNCEQCIDNALASRLTQLRLYLGQFDISDCSFEDGELRIDEIDACIEIECHEDDTIETLFDGFEDQLHEEVYDRFSEFGLDFAYDSENDCYSYLLSWGGPSDGFRFYRDRIEYYYLDWFDGAVRDVSHIPVAQDLYSYFAELDCINFERDSDA